MLTKNTEAKDNINYNGVTSKSNSSVKFKISIEENLHKDFCFKKLQKENCKELQRFIDKTIGNKLTISEVEKQFLRRRSKPFTKEEINGVEREVCHFKVSEKFRIHGYYNDGYFVIHKIDPNHK